MNERETPGFWLAAARYGPLQDIERTEEYWAVEKAIEMTDDFQVEEILRYWAHSWNCCGV